MVKFIRYSVLCSCFLVVFTVSVRADDDVKRLIGGLAVGIVGQMLENTSENNQQAPAQKVLSQKKPTSSLQASDEVWEHQMMLKKMGFYDGALDGLKGSGTINAIKKWERSHNLVADGVISDDEYQLLHYDLKDEHDQIKYWKERRQLLATKTENPVNESKDTNAFYTIAEVSYQYDDMTTNCERLANSYHKDARVISRTLRRSYSKFQKLNEKTLKLYHQCKLDEPFETYQQQAEERYKQSDMAKMFQLQSLMEPSFEDDMRQKIQACNIMEKALIKTMNDHKNKEFTCDNLSEIIRIYE